jgi:agmatine/peptidylarginine deiminase
MNRLEQLLSGFSLSDTSRKRILEGNNKAPIEFEQIAQVALAGHFFVKGKGHDIEVRPTCVEFYYHEEAELGIKDNIVYHRNTKDSPKFAFEFGTLHNHVSGVDITFEQGDEPNTAIRASMLIREFEVDGKNDDRSTMLYEALYQQSSVFSGISVHWVDGDEPVDVISDVRKNVAQFDVNSEKKKASDYPDLSTTKDKKFVQDLRKWQFKRKQVTDSDTNKVYISSWLKDECPNFYGRFIILLQDNGIAFQVMQSTNDIWARDYMPIQIYDDHFVQYCYNPNYLQKSDEDKESITDVDSVCKELGISTYKTDLVIDGGNVVKAGKYIIMTEKVYIENSHLKPAEVRAQLRSIFHSDVLMLPWDKNEPYGHADGIVKAIDDNTVLLTNYNDFDPRFAKRFEEILSKHFTVKKLSYHVEHRNKNNWAYINFLRVGDIIILPGLETEEDGQALSQIQGFFPKCKVLQIDASEVVEKGGALNCITWNTKSVYSNILFIQQ